MYLVLSTNGHGKGSRGRSQFEGSPTATGVKKAWPRATWRHKASSPGRGAGLQSLGALAKGEYSRRRPGGGAKPDASSIRNPSPRILEHFARPDRLFYISAELARVSGEKIRAGQ